MVLGLLGFAYREAAASMACWSVRLCLALLSGASGGLPRGEPVSAGLTCFKLLALRASRLCVLAFDGRALALQAEGATIARRAGPRIPLSSVLARPGRPAERSGRVNNRAQNLSPSPQYIEVRFSGPWQTAYLASWSVTNTRSLDHNARAKKGQQ